MAHTTNIL